jgi:hypothetical protein
MTSPHAWRTNHARSDVVTVCVQLADIAGVLVVINYFIAVSHNSFLGALRAD